MNFLQFPDDIFGVIFGRLSGKDLVSVMKTCKEMHSRCADDEIWQRISENTWEDASLLPNLDWREYFSGRVMLDCEDDRIRDEDDNYLIPFNWWLLQHPSQQGDLLVKFGGRAHSEWVADVEYRNQFYWEYDDGEDCDYDHDGFFSSRIGNAGIRLMARNRLVFAQVKELILVDIGLGEAGCKELASAAEHGLPFLNYLCLARNPHISGTGMRHIGKVVVATGDIKLKLELHECGLTDEDISVVSNAMSEKSSGMTEIDLSENSFGPVGCEALERFFALPKAKSIVSVHLHSNKLTNAGAAHLVTILSKVRHLCLAGCHLGNDAVRRFAETIPECRNLREFDLGSNNIRGPAAYGLIRAVKHIPSEISFDNCMIDQRGLQAITSCVLDKGNTIHVVLTRNPGAARDCGDVARRLAHDPFALTKACRRPKEVVWHQRVVTDLRTRIPLLSAKPMPREIRLPFAKLKDVGVAMLCKALARNTVVTVLDLSDNGLTDTGCQHVATLLTTNVALPLRMLILGKSGCAEHFGSNEIRNMYTAAGATAVAAALPLHRDLHTVNFNATHMGNLAAVALLQTQSCVQEFDMRDCELTSEVQAAAKLFLTRSRDNVLRLEWNRVSARVLAELRHLQAVIKADDVYEIDVEA